MIYLITGKTGNGKTLYAITKIEEKRKAENRQVFYHGIPNVKLDWTYFDDPEKWYTLPQGAIIVIDEAGEFFPPRPSTAAVPETVHAFSIHRKQGHDVFIITQHPSFIDSYIRKLVDLHHHLVRVFGKEQSNVHTFNTVKDSCEKERNGSIEVKTFDFPKENYDKYQSIDEGGQHTIKPHVPMKYRMRYIIPLVVIALCVFAYIGLDKASHSAEEVISKDRQNLTKSDHSSFAPLSNDDPDYFYVMNTPRIKSLPQTAPKYDKLTEATVAPYPAACISMGDRCQCFSQQGTKLPTDKNLCLNIVENGYFLDFEAEGKTKPRQNNQQQDKQPEQTAS